MAICVLRRGEVVFEGAWGYVDSARVQPVSRETMFDIASLSKPFTAALALQEVAAGRLSLDDLIHTQVRHRSHHHQRLAVPARDSEELESRLSALVERGVTSGTARGEAPYGPAPQLVFVYTGMGPQTYAMGTELCRQFPVFAQAFRESLDAFASLSGQDLRPELEKARPGDTPPTAR